MTTTPSFQAPRARQRLHHHRVASACVTALAALAAWTGLVPQAAQAQVGMAQLQAGELPVTLVYPTAEPARRLTLGPFELGVAPDAVPRPGRHRLIVMSHGTGGSPITDHALAATLARAGFVVAQPLHQGDNHQDTRDAGPESWKRRPGEAMRVIDLLASHPTWQHRVQTDRVGVHGMSAGGTTALQLAGAQWSVLSLVQHCLAHGDADFGFCFNGAPGADAQAARRRQFDGLRDVPPAQLPDALRAWHGGRVAAPGADPRPDPRVVATSLLVPVAAPFSAESLARIRVPVGVVSASGDTMLLPSFHSDHVLRQCGTCARLDDLNGGGHMDALAPWPREVALSVARLHPRGAEPQAGFDPAVRQRAFDRVAAFYRQHLPALP
jgi:predicted dienelactone hydrolase